eukprot:4843964-Pyramimonas_sp.AAC.1
MPRGGLSQAGTRATGFCVQRLQQAQGHAPSAFDAPDPEGRRGASGTLSSWAGTSTGARRCLAAASGTSAATTRSAT